MSELQSLLGRLMQAVQLPVDWPEIRSTTLQLEEFALTAGQKQVLENMKRAGPSSRLTFLASNLQTEMLRGTVGVDGYRRR